MKTTSEILRCIPTPVFEAEENPDNGKVTIIRPKFTSHLGQVLFGSFMRAKHFKIHLDEIGSAVWKNMNGENDVQRIGEILAAQFGPEIEPIYDRLTQFIMQMYRQKFIHLDCPETADA